MPTLTSDDMTGKLKLFKLLELNVLQSYNLTDSVRTATQNIMETTTQTLVDNATILICQQMFDKTFDSDPIAHNLCLQFYKNNKQLYTSVIECTLCNLINSGKMSFADVLLQITRFKQRDIDFLNFRTLIQTIKLIQCSDPNDNLSFMRWRLKDLVDSYDDDISVDYVKSFSELSDDIAEYGKNIDSDDYEEVPSVPKSKWSYLFALLAFLPLVNPSTSSFGESSLPTLNEAHVNIAPIHQPVQQADVPETDYFKKDKKNKKKNEI